tara:strand:+ start:747 stop:965 length:219 start_codon:yes stop_codon:yes gene_type:complete
MKNPTILIDVDSDGGVSVYWHDTEESGRVAPEISVMYSSERNLSNVHTPELQKMIDDHDSMIEAEWGTQQIF